jgi:hypothetical protein
MQKVGVDLGIKDTLIQFNNLGLARSIKSVQLCFNHHFSSTVRQNRADQESIL